MSNQDIFWMKKACSLAKVSYNRNEVPVGAVIVCDGCFVSSAYNERHQSKHVSAHAEILAINRAAEIFGDWRLSNCELYVTLEPCPMCAGAIVESRISKVVFSCFDYKNGAFGGRFDIRKMLDNRANIEVVTGVLHEEYCTLLSNFFKGMRT